MKFLVTWELDLSLLGPQVLQAVMRMPEYAEKIEKQGKLPHRYHIVGRHGGAWLFETDSNEELERLLAASPVYNFARFTVSPLAEMATPGEIVQMSPKTRTRRRNEKQKPRRSPGQG